MSTVYVFQIFQNVSSLSTKNGTHCTEERKDEERDFARTYNSTSSETAMKQFSRSSKSI
jgi:hypothetical protein